MLAERARRRARTNLEAWCTEALRPQGFKPAAHHRLLIEHLEAVSRGDIRRLMVLMPPGSAKSTYASKLFPCWWWARHPGSQILGASHTADLAEDFSAEVQGFVRDNAATLGFGLASDAKQRWSTTNGGRYLAAGVGRAIAGFRADLAIVDDPIRGRADADSQTTREAAWKWFKADLRTRLRPGGRIVLINTRWHEDDPAGRFLTEQARLWTVLKLPAIAVENDPLGRAPGEWLWSDDEYGYAAEARGVLDESGEDRDWFSLYQQEPRPLSGALFRIPKIAVLPAAPADVVSTVRAWDLAGTAQVGTKNPDWTVGLKLARRANGQFAVLDVVRLRGDPADVEAAIVNTASQDGRDVRIGLPQDPGQAGKQQVVYLTGKLAGYTVETSPESGDKAERAMPVASQVNVGNLVLVQSAEPNHWNRPFLDELGMFPGSAKKDQVDALSRAFGMLIGPVVPSPLDRLRAIM